KKRRRAKEGPPEKSNEATPPPPAVQAEAKRIIPEGVDEGFYLECPWLENQDTMEQDNIIDSSELWSSILEARGLRDTNQGLTVAGIQEMTQRAVDEGSTDDLMRLVWALRMVYEPQFNDPDNLKVVVGSAEYQALVQGWLSRGHMAFARHLTRTCAHERDNGEEGAQGKCLTLADRVFIEKTDGWARLGRALHVFLSSALTVLSSGDSRTSPRQSLVLMRNHIPLLFPFPLLSRRYLSALLSLLASNDDREVLSVAFLRLYELATSQTMPLLHDALKGVYWSYRRAATRSSATVRRKPTDGGRETGRKNCTLPLLRECVSELYGVERPSSYLHAFVYIHDLVMTATAAVAEAKSSGWDSKEAGPALKRARTKEFVLCLKLWSLILCKHSSGKTDLSPLVTPLAKALETMLHATTSVFAAPLIFQIARMAQDLAASASIFLPTSPSLLRVIELLHSRRGHPCPSGVQSPAAAIKNRPGRMRSKATGEGGGLGGGGGGGVTGKEEEEEGGGNEADLLGKVWLDKEDLRWGRAHASLMREASYLVVRDAGIYRYSPGLPEYCSSLLPRLGQVQKALP
ncbi:unnamed protein product, partial [Discosporangium mesarthrocarpum]